MVVVMVVAVKKGPSQGREQAQDPNASVSRNDTRNYENAVKRPRLCTLGARRIKNRLRIARRH